MGFFFNKSYLSLFNKLEYIATITTGTDHIDENYCLEKRIKVISLKGHIDFLKQITSTPEHTWGLLLSLIRKIPDSFNSVLANNWNTYAFEGIELKGKTLGIIGMGRVGKIVAGYGLAFQMKVLGFDKNWSSEEDLLASPTELLTLCKNSDVISLHLELNKDTIGFFNEIHFKAMKNTAVLINTSRGKILEEKALLNALETNKIAGAALDVLSEEDSLNNNLLIQYAKNHSNLLITPHIAGNTFEAKAITAKFILSLIPK